MLVGSKALLSFVNLKEKGSLILEAGWRAKWAELQVGEWVIAHLFGEG